MFVPFGHKRKKVFKKVQRYRIKNKHFKLCRSDICAANFKPLANGASLDSYLVKNDILVKEGENKLTKIALAARHANLS